MISVIVQPRDGIDPLLDAIRRAQSSVEVTIYRADRLEIEQALVEAANRGVRVHVLTTTTNRVDAKNLRRLEARLKMTRVKVTQTARDFIRYHNKMLIIDRRLLYLLTFNFTFLDLHHSRSLGLVIDDPEAVDEAVRVFETDAERAVLVPPKRLVVSPDNAREQISKFILDAERQLLIYDGRLNDARIHRLLWQRARDGIDIKVVGEMSRRIKGVEIRPMPLISLHAQAVIRDQSSVFIGSQSLRRAELDSRREVGIIVDNVEVARQLVMVFQLDWG